MEDFDAPAQRFGERRRAYGHHHEFLEIDVVIGVRATVEDVHHRNRQHAGVHSAQVTVERHLVQIRDRTRSRHRNRKNGVRAQTALVLCAIQFDHFLIERALIFGIFLNEGVRQLAVDVLDRLGNAFAQIARLVAVAQLNRLVLAGGGAAGDGRAANRTAGQENFCFYRGIAA